MQIALLCLDLKGINIPELHGTSQSNICYQRVGGGVGQEKI